MLAAVGLATSVVPLHVVAQALPKPSGPIFWTRSREFKPPKIVRSGTQIIAERLALPVSKDTIRGSHPQTANTPGKWPGATSMGSTGEREELGIVSDDIALFLMGGSASDMIVWAETHGQVPVHFRVNDMGQADPAGKHMVDIRKLPRASCYYDQRAVNANPHFPISGPFEPDMAHYPSVAYVPYLATGDLWYLQELQDAATFQLINGGPDYRKLDQGLLREDQTRGYAWGLRDLAQTYLATPEDAPSPLLPKSYWKRILDNNRDHFLATWVGKNGCHFAIDIEDGRVAPWQQDMLGAVIGWMIWTGKFSDWRPIYDWHIQQAIDRTSGKSGYPRSQAVQYYYPKNANSMAELASVNKLAESTGAKLVVPNDFASYAAYLRANLKLAVANAVPGAQECFAYVDTGVKWIPPKWAV